MIDNNQLYVTLEEGGVWIPVKENSPWTKFNINWLFASPESSPYAAIRRGCIVFDFVIANTPWIQELEVSPWRFVRPEYLMG